VVLGRSTSRRWEKGASGVSADLARTLSHRIAEYQQWQRADAVRAGEQPNMDPDAADLVEMADDLRLYARRAGERMRKRLIEGRWETDFIR
jgi:hypothetical protein